MSLYDVTIARFGQRSCFRASLSAAGAAAKPCARLVHESCVRVGPWIALAAIRPRYAARSVRLRSLMRSVTSRTREFSGCDDVDIAGESNAIPRRADTAAQRQPPSSQAGGTSEVPRR